jgi:hypothetical protein
MKKQVDIRVRIFHSEHGQIHNEDRRSQDTCKSHLEYKAAKSQNLMHSDHPKLFLILQNELGAALLRHA